MPLMNLLGSTDSGLVTMDTWQPVIDALTAQISVANVVTVVAGIVTLSIGGVFMWWGLRKAYKAIMKSTTKGKGGV